MLLVCKICCDSLPHIRNEARLRGIKKEMVMWTIMQMVWHLFNLLPLWKNIERTCS